MASFNVLLPIVLQWEGTKFVDDPNDNGGATKYGVTQNTLSDFLGRKATKQEVKNLTVESVKPIYRKKYWDKIYGDELSEGAALIIFDGAINHGLKRMTEIVQRIVGVNVDGDFGPKTLKAIKEYKSQFDLVLAISNSRRDRYENHEDFAHFGKGWLNRLKDITNKALAYENKYVVKKPEVEIIEEQEEVVEWDKPIEIEDVDDFLSNETLQKLLSNAGFYTGKIDGLFGNGSKTAMVLFLREHKINFTNWSDERRKIATGQQFAQLYDIEVGKIDGLAGPQTKQAFRELNYKLLTNKELPKIEVLSKPAIVQSNNNWPLRRDCAKFYGPVGKNQVNLILPYKMRLAWDLNTTISRFQCHEKVHDALLRIFQNTLSEYGEKKIQALKLDLFGGCLNVRNMRGGSSPSVHSWGAAVDIDPENNQLKWNHKKATLARPEYDAFWRIVEAEGGLSLGRREDRDWMHFEFTKG